MILIKNWKLKCIFCIFFLSLSFAAFANGLEDKDRDGIPDNDEINIYKTDPNNSDTDGDGFSDWVELNNGYSPHNPSKITLTTRMLPSSIAISLAGI